MAAVVPVGMIITETEADKVVPLIRNMEPGVNICREDNEEENERRVDTAVVDPRHGLLQRVSSCRYSSIILRIGDVGAARRRG